MEKHSLVALVVILLRNLPPSVAVLLPQFRVPEIQKYKITKTQKLFSNRLVRRGKGKKLDLLFFENAVIGEYVPALHYIQI